MIVQMKPNLTQADFLNMDTKMNMNATDTRLISIQVASCLSMTLNIYNTHKESEYNNKIDTNSDKIESYPGWFLYTTTHLDTTDTRLGPIQANNEVDADLVGTVSGLASIRKHEPKYHSHKTRFHPD